jgi:hypothetical protein
LWSLHPRNSLTAGSREGTLTERGTLGSTVRRVINGHIVDVHRRVLRRDHFELVCECGDCELVPIRVPSEVYEEAQSHGEALLVHPEHVQDADIVAHCGTVSIVRRRDRG